MPVATPKDVLDWVTNRGGRPALLYVERQRDTQLLKIQSVMACGYPVVLVTHDSVNAFADGRFVGVTSGMLRFAESDDELAIVIGHELAHNALGHFEKMHASSVGARLLGGLLDIAAAAVGVGGPGGMQDGATAAALVHGRDFETEADSLGLYLVARAGYDFSAAPDFWRRMGAELPEADAGGFLATHPSHAERAVAVEAIVDEIRAKLAAGAPLEPEQR